MRFCSRGILLLMLMLPVRLISQPTYFSVPPVDAPELAPRGMYPVGVRTIELLHRGQVDILHFDKTSGKAALYDRQLPVEIWYPAVIPPGQTEATVYHSAMVGRTAQTGSPASFDFPGKALRDAAPLAGKVFPLVVVSHGYPGSRTFLTYLTENLVSKGYVVAAIDHTDSVFGAVKAFESTLLNRSADQLFTVAEIVRLAGESTSFLHGLVDAAKTAIVGYSMGGYGALASAGASYSEKAVSNQLVPGHYFNKTPLDDASAQAQRNLKAVVAIAPWGAQPPINSWTAEGLAGIHIPTLFIDGDQDDVSDYLGGVKKAYDEARNSDRCLLVYENARHNVGGNPPPPNTPLSFTALEAFEEPVWRKDRIAAINQHFITAFLDLYLKGEESRRSYLHVAPVRANDGKWPLPFGQSTGGTFSNGIVTEGQPYWKGFQRRWALGLEMHCQAPR